MSNRLTVARLLFVLVLLVPTISVSQETQIRWFGHSAFAITTPKGKVLLIDPWLRNPANPDAKDGRDPLAALSRVDYILLTHGHRDHVGDAAEIAQKTGAVLISNPELAANLVRLGGFPAKQAETDALMGIGGEIQVADGEVVVAMVPAIHSSSVFNSKAGSTEAEREYGGSACGFVVKIASGPTIYHTGDTAYFRDMETIGDSYAIDVGLINIGGHYGMEPRMAAKAAVATRSRLAIPHHYGTAPGLAQNAREFTETLRSLGGSVREMKPGETLRFRGGKLIN